MRGNEELSYVNEFCYIGHIIATDCRDDKDIEKRLRRLNTVPNMLVTKFSSAPMHGGQVILLPN